jgi:hypothetical protein
MAGTFPPTPGPLKTHIRSKNILTILQLKLSSLGPGNTKTNRQTSCDALPDALTSPSISFSRQKCTWGNSDHPSYLTRERLVRPLAVFQYNLGAYSWDKSCSSLLSLSSYQRSYIIQRKVTIIFPFDWVNKYATFSDLLNTIALQVFTSRLASKWRKESFSSFPNICASQWFDLARATSRGHQHTSSTGTFWVWPLLMLRNNVESVIYSIEWSI